MNISNNYQILSYINTATCYNKEKYKNSIANSLKPTSYPANSNNCCDKFVSNVYNDNITFKSSFPDIKLVNAVQKIFDRSIVFGPAEYKNLSSSEISILKEYQKFFLAYKSNHSDFTFISKFGELFSQQLRKKYPNGFTFVSVGRSPAFLAKYIEFQGEDVKYCPISNMRMFIIKKFSPRFLEAYKKYLSSIDLTKEMVQSTKKPIIITDYTYDGFSLANFKKLLELPEIGILEGEKVKFSPITICSKFERENCIFNHDPYYNFRGNYEKWDFSDGSYIYNMKYEKTKCYTSIPCIDVRKFGAYEEDVLNKYYKNGNKFEENYNTKTMNFLIADSISKEYK